MANMKDFPILYFLMITVFLPVAIGFLFLNNGLNAICEKIYSKPKYFDIEIINDCETAYNTNITYSHIL